MTKRYFIILFFALLIILIFIGYAKREPLRKPSFEGIGIWITDIKEIDDINDFVNVCKYNHVNSVYVKGHDGSWIGHGNGSDGRRNDQLSKLLIRSFHEKGINVFAWGFSRAVNIEKETKNIITFLHRGADGYIFNPEKELEDKELATEDLVNRIIVHQKQCSICRDKLLGYSPAPHVRTDRARIAWGSFHGACTAVFPQVYWNIPYKKWRVEKGEMLSGCKSEAASILSYVAEYDLREYQKLRHLEINPLLYDYKEWENSEELKEYLSLCHEYGYQGVSIFGGEYLSDEHWKLIRSFHFNF